jgi:hypothetical protein
MKKASFHSHHSRSLDRVMSGGGALAEQLQAPGEDLDVHAGSGSFVNGSAPASQLALSSVEEVRLLFSLGVGCVPVFFAYC